MTKNHPAEIATLLAPSPYTPEQKEALGRLAHFILAGIDFEPTHAQTILAIMADLEREVRKLRDRLHDWHETSDVTTDQIERLTKERDAARAGNERDRSRLIDGLALLDRALRACYRVTEGRGSYAWDDPEYRGALVDAANRLQKGAEALRTIAIDMLDCPPTQREVEAARATAWPPIMPMETCPDRVPVLLLSKAGNWYAAKWDPVYKWFEPADKHLQGVIPIGSPADGHWVGWWPLPPIPTPATESKNAKSGGR